MTEMHNGLLWYAIASLHLAYPASLLNQLCKPRTKVFTLHERNAVMRLGASMCLVSCQENTNSVRGLMGK